MIVDVQRVLGPGVATTESTVVVDAAKRLSAIGEKV